MLLLRIIEYINGLPVIFVTLLQLISVLPNSFRLALLLPIF